MTLALIVAVVTSLALLGLVIVLFRRQVRGRDHAATSLRLANEALEVRLRMRTASLVATNDELRREIAERVRIADDLRPNAERYQALVTATAAIVWGASADETFETAPPEWAASTGHAPDEFRGRRWLDTVHPDDRSAFADARASANADPREFKIEYRLRDTDGTYHRMSVQGIPLQNADGTVREWVGLHADVTSEPGRESECPAPLAQLALQIEHLPLAYFVSDANNRFTYWNRAAERVFGFARADVVGKCPFEVIVPARERGLAESTFARLATGDRDAHGLFENVTKSGREITCEWHNAPLFDATGAFQGVLALAQDVTARQRLGDQVRQVQKMDAICQLAGGVAHDFNNLLTIINGYTRLLAGACPDGTPDGEALAEIRDASERATNLTRQLLAFGRLQVLRPHLLNVNGLITEAQKVLAKVVGEGVRLVCSLSPGLELVTADPDQIEQVLMNLCVYARESMPQGGRLTLATDAVEVGAGPTGDRADVPPGRYVRLTVTDTGYGLTADVKAQIFEPFFSPQGVGKGAGLALAAVFGIVKQSGGHIAAESTIGTGTAFTIHLPVAVQTAPPAGSKSIAPLLPRSGEKILLVEDERPIRALAALALRGAGYTVLEAASGEDAVELFRAQSSVHLLLTDVVMPGMNGRELAEVLREQEPNLKLLYMSGYTDDAKVRHGIASIDAEFLQKPFEVDDLLLKVRQVLDEDGSHTRSQELAGSAP
ncbi:PAS domain S-box protein [Gemmata sp. G18]|uniref:histidine kinase n=1 Tax=Gemmata palustris TaxID=2822762 RepID=A0ABS5BXM0_9BACT|nr:PAS domain-containing sensor histidine kinase [Gemmata palustris]MBP3958444.1 PAS domain S-box protein [Gemmata palustris]